MAPRFRSRTGPEVGFDAGLRRRFDFGSVRSRMDATAGCAGAHGRGIEGLPVSAAPTPGAMSKWCGFGSGSAHGDWPRAEISDFGSGSDRGAVRRTGWPAGGCAGRSSLAASSTCTESGPF